MTIDCNKKVAETITFKIDIYPVKTYLKRRKYELDRDIPIRGTNYRGSHRYMITADTDRSLRYMGTDIQFRIKVSEEV